MVCGMTSTSPVSEFEKSSIKTSLRTVNLHGRAGQLEGLLNEGGQDSRFCGLVCHPHPLGGGTMHNKVVYHAMKVLNAPEWDLRWPVLRFNFRGTGLSEGQHDGLAESADVITAIDWLQAEYKLPVILVGFSFGAAMSIKASCATDSSSTVSNLRALVSLGLPTQGFGQTYHYPVLANCALPKLFLSGDSDMFAPQQDLRKVVDHAADPKQLVFVAGADHFFRGRLEAMQKELACWLKENVQ